MSTRLSLFVVISLLTLTLSGPSVAATSGEHLQLAEQHRDGFRLEQALAEYRLAVAVDASPAAACSFAEYLLALGRFDEAGEALQAALEAFPEDAVLLELRAVLAAGRGHHDQAVTWLQRSSQAGRASLAWVERGRLRLLAEVPPYRDLLDPDTLLSGLTAADPQAQVELLRLLAVVITPEDTAGLVSFLLAAADPAVIRSGIHALVAVEGALAGNLEGLLAAEEPRLRRQVLLAVWQRQDPAALPALAAAEADETDPGNADLLAVLLALLRSRNAGLDRAEALLVGVPATNRFRHLALYALAERLQLSGQGAQAEDLRRLAASAQPEVSAAKSDAQGALQGYWECMDRADRREMRALLEHHRSVAPIDARAHGLPEHDFDDQKLLTIPERLFLRAYATDHDLDFATSGPRQYPREIKHFLRKLGHETGSTVDCAGHLAALEEGPALRALGEDGSEAKLQENTAADNEVNIVVNPIDPRYVVATSNPTGYTGNKVYRSSDWGNTWTSSYATVADNCCDPVSNYNRTLVNGSQTDVLYHSTLVGNATIKSRVLYSTDNGANWSDCGASIGSGDRDRQDHAVDGNPSSPCYNTIYLAHHDGTQYVAASTGTSFPYCQSFNEQSTGVGDTIGSAIVISSNGIAHDFFTQFGSPGGLYHVQTSSCGSSWSSATRLLGINNAGTFEWGIPSTCQRQVYRYPQADSDRQSSSAFHNNIYVAWNDLSSSCSAPGCNGNTTCNNDVYVAVGVPSNRSNPSSWTWTSLNLTDSLSDDYTDEFYPSLSVDQADGSIYLSYYRSGSGAPGGAAGIAPRKTAVHYVMLRSIDGGASWQPPLQITDLPTDESGSGANADMQWGDYAWNDVANGVAYAAWTDRREGADEDIWAAKICSEPTHWSERAPSFTPSPTAASPAGGNTYALSWAAPDVYWGDGGESPSQRRYQLWVDGAVAVDSIAWTTTSTTWSAPDANQHQLYIRAINQCGVSKDYAPATVGSGGGGNTPPQVSISSPANGSEVAQGTTISFAATADDSEDGDLTASLSWSSSIDGVLGSGGQLARQLSVGSHTISAAVSDSGGLPGSASVTITVTAGCSGGPVLDESFESGAGSWSSDGLWHLAADSSCASPGYSSASHAWYYGRDQSCTYSTGGTTSGNLVSPEIDGLTASSMLSFAYYREVEYETWFDGDRSEVAVSLAGSGTWTTIWSRDSSNASAGAWTSSGEISLAAFAAQTIRLRFRFDSIDEVANGFTGWLIDDVVVTGEVCGPATGDIFSDGFDSGDLSAWSSASL